MGDLAVAGEIERDRFVPGAVGRIDRQRAAAAGIVDEDVDMAELGNGRGGELVGGAFGHDVLDHRNDGAAGGLDLGHQRLQQFLPPRHANHAHAFLCQPAGDGAADPDAGSGYHRRPGFELEIHIRSFRSQGDLRREGQTCTPQAVVQSKTYRPKKIQRK